MFNVNSHANKFFDLLEIQSEQASFNQEFIFFQIEGFYKKTPRKDRDKFIKQLSLVFHADKKIDRNTQYPLLSRFLGEDDTYQIYINNIIENGFLVAPFVRNFVSLALKYNNNAFHWKFILKAIYYLHFKTFLPKQNKEKFEHLVATLSKHSDLEHLGSDLISLILKVSYYLVPVLLAANIAPLIALPILIIATPILFILAIVAAIGSLFLNDKYTTFKDPNGEELSIKQALFGMFLISLGLTVASIIATPVLLPVLIVTNLMLILAKSFLLTKDYLENIFQKLQKIFLLAKNVLESMFQEPKKIQLEAPPKTFVNAISETNPQHFPSIIQTTQRGASPRTEEPQREQNPATFSSP